MTNKKEGIFSNFALAVQDESYAKVAGWFLGPKAENAFLMNKLLAECIADHETFRYQYKPNDPAYIDETIMGSDEYANAVQQMSDTLQDLMARLHKRTEQRTKGTTLNC